MTLAAGPVTTGSVTANGASGAGAGVGSTTTVNVCGVVSAFTAPSASAPGSVTVGGQTIPIAAGASLSGADLLKAGANVCVSGSNNSAGQLTTGSVGPNGASGAGAGATSTTNISVCGVVSAFNHATASAPGSVTIGGENIPIAAGAALTGTGLLNAGSNVCLAGQVNGNGQVTSGSTPPKHSNSVVLPDPFGPIRPSTSPGRTLNDTSLNAVSRPYRLVRLLA